MSLASILPGLRQVRAPLVSGYVYLLAIAIAVGHHVSSRSEATGVLQTVWRLYDAASPVGVAIAVSVAAYLLGSVAEAALLTVSGLTRRFGKPPRDRLTSRGYEALREVTDDIVTRVRATLANTGNTLLSVRQADVLPPDSVLGRILMEAARLGPGFSTYASASAQEEVLEDGMRVVVSNAVLQRLDVLPVRLLGEDPDFYAVLDRLESEAELRRSLVPALVVCLGVLAVAASPLWLVGIGPVVLLWQQAASREQEARDQALEALVVERLTLPMFDRLLLEAKALPAVATVGDAAKRYATL